MSCEVEAVVDSLARQQPGLHSKFQVNETLSQTKCGKHLRNDTQGCPLALSLSPYKYTYTNTYTTKIKNVEQICKTEWQETVG